MSKKQGDRKASLPRLLTSSSVFSKKPRKPRKIKVNNDRLHKSSIYYVAEEPNSRIGILEKFLDFLLEDKIYTRLPLVRKLHCEYVSSIDSVFDMNCISKDFQDIQENDLHQTSVIGAEGSKLFLNKINPQVLKSSILHDTDNSGLGVIQETNNADGNTLPKIPDAKQSIDMIKYIDEPMTVIVRLEKIIFCNGNVYEGPTNECMMHGKGKFIWDDNTIYHGDFNDGYITGKGDISLPDLSTYRGEFCNGFFHGQGFLNVASTPICYSGDWKSDRKDGHGWILYGAGDWYEGEWKMDMRYGNGYRMYKDGANYKGDWVENKKQGKGRVLFYNDDYYNGEWYDDILNGYGEYTWDLIDNKAFCFPIYNWYKGAWKNGERDGIGIMNFGTECGAKYAGTWRNNIKHGPGVMICGNGLILESNPIFEYDKPVHKHSQISLTQLCEENQLPNMATEKSTYYDILELINSRIATYELDERILIKITANSENIPSNMFVKLADNISGGKKTWCPLHIQTHTTAEEVDLKYFVDLIFDDTLKKTSCEYLMKLLEEPSFHTKGSGYHRGTLFVMNYDGIPETGDNDLEMNDPQEKIRLLKTKELKKLKNAIIIYLPKLKLIYEKYATFAKSKSMIGDINLDFKPVLVRFFLWQLLRDLRVTEEGVELVDIDILLWENPESCLDTQHYPFQPIYFYQFIMYLFGAAWLCFKIRHKKIIDIDSQADGDFVEKKTPSSIFRHFLDTRLESVEKLEGSPLEDHLNLVPLNNLYGIYTNIGEPMTVKSFLNATYRSKEEELPCYYTIYTEKNSKTNIRDGYNAVPVAHDVHFIYEPQALNERSRKSAELSSPTTLFTFRTLGKKTILDTITKICPKVTAKNMCYKISFLEFLEIVILLAFEKAEEQVKNDQTNVNKITTTLSELSYKTRIKRKKTK